MIASGPKGKASVSRRKNEFGEYVVRFWEADGTRNKNADYFTSDYDDACGTARAMSGDTTVGCVNNNP